jgi:hypothetical protein
MAPLQTATGDDQLHPFRLPVLFGLLLVLPVLAQPTPPATSHDFRPPAVPLVAHDPYFSVWSTRNTLTEDWPKHWTGAVNGMCGMVRIDGKTYRFLSPQPAATRVLEQEGLDVWPTRTRYLLRGGGVRLSVTFTTPALPEDLDVLSRPVTYVTWDAASDDGGRHRVSVYLDCTGEWAVNTAEQEVVWSRETADGLDALRVGSRQQPVLAKSGDNLRIDWGYLYVAAPRSARPSQALVGDRAARDTFAASGRLPAADDARMPRPARDNWPVLATTLDLGRVGRAPVSRHLLIAYDDQYSIEYFHKWLRPYWRRDGMDARGLLRAAERDYAPLTRRCESFDAGLMTDLTRAGGERYARLCALAFRECLAAHKLAADADGTPLYFPKENFSNGCISTVDVLYPSSPFFLLFNTALLRAQLTPVLEYARSGRWRFPFAPHDLGTYPKANGQVYGGGERTETDQMPVEESGNMLLMLAAMAKADGNADYALRYWPLLSRWAQYLREKGMDPENQLCTDDFAGHLAHNTNLSLKAILALGGYASLCQQVGKTAEAAEYRRAAKEMAGRWTQMAADGDHYRLTFDRPNTWSQKYNLVWDRLLGLDLFPRDVAAREVAYYKRVQNRYGLPLDNRSAYTKLDWTVWSATLAEQPGDFETLVNPLYAFANDSPSRVPLTDWFWTTDAKQVGFQARSVVGGIYIKLLADPETWRYWSGRR